MTKPTQDLEFWRKRLREVPNPLDAIGVGFNWTLLNDIHFPIVEKFISREVKVLDVACGIGRIATWFHPNLYLGIDFVPEFIEIAKKKHSNHKFQVCDITKLPLPFKDHEFDWALLISVKVVIAPVIGYEKWSEVEKDLKRVCGNVLILEYGNNDPKEASKYEML